MEQELRISQRAKQYPASGIRKMFDLAAQYPEAIKLTVGEPNFDTPQYIKDAAKRALDEGQTHYAPNAGTTELREAVAAKYRKQYWGSMPGCNSSTCGCSTRSARAPHPGHSSPIIPFLMATCA